MSFYGYTAETLRHMDEELATAKRVADLADELAELRDQLAAANADRARLVDGLFEKTPRGFTRCRGCSYLVLDPKGEPYVVHQIACWVERLLAQPAPAADAARGTKTTP